MYAITYQSISFDAFYIMMFGSIHFFSIVLEIHSISILSCALRYYKNIVPQCLAMATLLSTYAIACVRCKVCDICEKCVHYATNPATKLQFYHEPSLNKSHCAHNVRCESVAEGLQLHSKWAYNLSASVWVNQMEWCGVVQNFVTKINL